jgi:hypothetical protein
MAPSGARHAFAPARRHVIQESVTPAIEDPPVGQEGLRALLGAARATLASEIARAEDQDAPRWHITRMSAREPFDCQPGDHYLGQLELRFNRSTRLSPRKKPRVVP